MNTTIKYIISLEGNIGAGKSTLMSLLEEKLKDRVEFIYEPVDEWIEIKDKNNNNLLDTFYKDKNRWSYTFQSVAYITRMNKIMEKMCNSNKEIIIMDRSLEGDYNTFTKMLREEDSINEIEWQCYMKWYKFFSTYIGKNIKHKYIYLRCDPSVAISRISKRNREEEKNISIDYINKLHECHESWMKEEEYVYNFNVNKDFVFNENKKTKILNWILNCN